MSTVPIICVQDVEKTSKLLQNLFNWKSNHGGPEFDDLADKSGRSVLWLHDFDSDHHPRFKGAGKKPMGIGASIYVLVDDLDAAYKRCQKADVSIVEELAMNENAQFREFTLKIKDGHQFTACEQGPYLNI
jgi:hypothetical protein